jgi:hypothetical protein
MKKYILFLLLIIPILGFGQIKISGLSEATGINSTDLFLLTQGAASKKLKFSTLQYKMFNTVPFPLRLNYGSDSLRMSFAGDSVRHQTSQGFYSFDKPVYSQGVLLGSGGGSTDHLINWNSTDTAISIINNSTGLAVSVVNNSIDNAMHITNNSTGNAIEIKNVDLGSPIAIIDGSSDPLFVVNYLGMLACNSISSGLVNCSSVTSMDINAHQSSNNASLKGDVVVVAKALHTNISTTIASSSTITCTTNTFHVSGTTAINTISLTNLGTGNGVANIIYIIPDNIFTFGTSGNIALASTAVVNRMYTLIFDGTSNKWYPSY